MVIDKSVSAAGEIRPHSRSGGKRVYIGGGLLAAIIIILLLIWLL